MSDHAEFLETIRNTRTSNRLLCAGFQRDLSALLDGELGEGPAQRSLSHLEQCSSCGEFFQAIRLQALAHRDHAVPGSLARRIRRLRGEDLFEGLTDSEIVRRLANALYELGKAYVLVANDDDYLLQVVDQPVEIEEYTQNEAITAASAAHETGASSFSAEDLQNRLGDFLGEGRRLLNEALSLKPSFAEARLYSGFLHQLCGDSMSASAEYKEVFLRTDRAANRAHAAIQMGMLMDEQELHREALRMYRWVVASGLVDRKPEFSFVLHNIAVQHIALGQLSEACSMLRRIRDHHPGLWEQSLTWLRQAPQLLLRLSEDDSFRKEMESSEPTFFAA